MWFSRKNCFHLSYLSTKIHTYSVKGSRQTLDFLSTPETVQTKRAENNQPGGGGRGAGGGEKDECTKNSWILRPNPDYTSDQN